MADETEIVSKGVNLIHSIGVRDLMLKRRNRDHRACFTNDEVRAAGSVRRDILFRRLNWETILAEFINVTKVLRIRDIKIFLYRYADFSAEVFCSTAKLS